MSRDRAAQRIGNLRRAAFELGRVAPILLAALFVSSQAAAVSVKVNFSSTLDQNAEPGLPGLGVGSVSGTLGTFEVTLLSQPFVLDDVLVTVSGFDISLFPNGTPTLSLDFGLQFLLAVDDVTTPTDFSGSGLVGPSSDPPLPPRLYNNTLAGCPAPLGEICALSLFDSGGSDLVSATWNIPGGGSTTALSYGFLSYTYEIIEPPGPVIPEPSAVVLYGVALAVAGVSLRGRRR